MRSYATVALAAAAGCASGVLAAPQYSSHPEKADAVKAAFQRAWDGYYHYAFPNDSLKPISKSFQNDRNGWGASAIDALSTALVMNDEKVVNQIVDHIQTIDFTRTATGAEDVSVFETTIRYLAGLLSGYDFLTGPLDGLVADKAKVDKILAQATRLADVLSESFETETGIPHNTLIVENGTTRLSDETTNGLATMGTLVLEWTRLSDLTGEPRYGELTQRAEDYLLRPLNPDVGEPFPGLLGSNVFIENGTFADSSGGWNGGDDSYYEYLIKMYLYDSARFGDYLDRWTAAVDSSIEHLASHPSSRPDLTFLAAYKSKDELSFVSQHLTCFDGGNIILGGLTLNKQEYVDFGLALTAACHETYAATATHIGPEVFQWQDSKLGGGGSGNGGGSPAAPPEDQADFYADHGFWIQQGSYALRPEVIESYYYAYRATGDAKYQDWAWDAFVAINETCSAGVGFSTVKNVNAEGGGGFEDFQESFVFAEVLKYSYLIQADQDADWHVSADHANGWVFNTEAHPFKVRGKPS